MCFAEEVRKFSSACEHIIAAAATSGRILTEDEARLVCKEVLAKVIPPSTHTP
jgi:hypothetical protein